MNRFRYLIFLICTSCLSVPAAALADNNGGSGYSRYGLGDIQYFQSSIAAGMGGTGLAVLPLDEINRINPAAWVRINRTRFSVGVIYEGYSTSDASHSTWLSGMNFNGLAFAFPMVPRSGVVLSFGLTPYSRINYNVKTTDSAGTLGYNLQYIGNGGLSLAYFGLSASPTTTLHVGAKFNYIFGTSNYITRQTFTGNYTNVDFTRSVDLRGAGFTLGAAYTGLRTLLNMPQTNALTVGAFFSSAVNLTTETNRRYVFSTSTLTSHDTLTTPGGTTHIPIAAGAGISYGTERYLLAADYMFQQWSDLTIDDASVPEIRNSYRISAGAELLPTRDPGASSLQKWRYRLGVFYNSSYYRLRDEPINEIGVGGGFGIPIIGDMKLNIGAEYSMRGTTDKQLLKDRILRMTFTLSGGELWFVRPPEE